MCPMEFDLIFSTQSGSRLMLLIYQIYKGQQWSIAYLCFTYQPDTQTQTQTLSDLHSWVWSHVQKPQSHWSISTRRHFLCWWPEVEPGNLLTCRNREDNILTWSTHYWHFKVWEKQATCFCGINKSLGDSNLQWQGKYQGIHKSAEDYQKPILCLQERGKNIFNSLDRCPFSNEWLLCNKKLFIHSVFKYVDRCFLGFRKRNSFCWSQYHSDREDKWKTVKTV